MRNIIKINFIIMAFIVINCYLSCTVEDEISNKIQIPSWAVGLDGEGESIDSADGFCDCFETFDYDCEYTYIHADEVCEAYGVESWYEIDEYGDIDFNGIRNDNPDDELFLSCLYSSIYYLIEGYSTDYIKQVKAYGIDGHPEDHIIVKFYSIGYDNSNYPDYLTQCYIGTHSAAMSSCPNSSPLDIDFEDPWLFFDVTLPPLYTDGSGNDHPSTLKGFRICYDIDG